MEKTEGWEDDYVWVYAVFARIPHEGEEFVAAYMNMIGATDHRDALTKKAGMGGPVYTCRALRVDQYYDGDAA